MLEMGVRWFVDVHCENKGDKCEQMHAKGKDYRKQKLKDQLH